MGHNVDLGVFGITLNCKTCKKPLDISEVDIDCDITTHHPMQFTLSIQCLECEKENEFILDICEEHDSE